MTRIMLPVRSEILRVHRTPIAVGFSHSPHLDDWIIALACCYDRTNSVIWSYNSSNARVAMYSSVGPAPKSRVQPYGEASSTASATPSNTPAGAAVAVSVTPTPKEPSIGRLLFSQLARIAHEHTPTMRPSDFCINLPTPVHSIPYCMELSASAIGELSNFFARLVSRPDSLEDAANCCLVVRLWLYWYRQMVPSERRSLKTQAGIVCTSLTHDISLTH